MAQLRRVKKATTIAGTFGFALSIGYVMQYGDADASRFSDVPVMQSSVLAAQVDATPLQRIETLEPKVPSAAQLVTDSETTLRVDPDTVKLTALVAEAARNSIQDNADVIEAQKPAGPECDISVNGDVGEKATVILTVLSACRPDMAFEVQHDGMVFSAQTNADGQSAITVPALSVNASIFVTFENGDGAAVSTVVPDAETFNRVVLQWENIPAELIQLTNIEAITTGDLQRLGTRSSTSSRFAEVYSFPASYSVSEGLQDLTVQAAISDETCGQLLNAERFVVNPGEEPAFKDIRITLPDCAHVGSFLELKKILGGQTLLPQ